MNDPLTAAPGPDEGQAVQRLIGRVRAWQHRQPLAGRIEPAQVGGWGVVALPFAPAGTPAGRPTALFHQPALLPGLSHRALVEFALAHGVAERPGPASWPQRDVERADAAPEPAPLTLHLLTAAIQDLPDRLGAPPRAPRRLLLAPAHPTVWGPRPLSPRRVALAAAGAAALLLLAIAGWRAPPGPPPAAAKGPSPVASSAPAPAPAASATATAPASAPASAAVPAPAAASAAPAIASAPASAAAAGAVPLSAVAPASVPVASAGSAASAASASAVPSRALPPGPHFALVSVPVKQKAAAEFTLQRVQQVLGPAQGEMQVQIMPTPQGYVVTLWPLPSQADAERVAEVLARRGVPMKWMEF